MKIPFEYTVCSPTSNIRGNTEAPCYKGEIDPIRLDRQPYEMYLEARGYRFHLIFGSQVNGNFLCIPDWDFGCELASLTDKTWNLHSILHSGFQLEREEATAISWGLALASDIVKH